MTRLLAILWASIPPVLGGAIVQADDGVCVTMLRCEYRINPLGIDTAAPRLSWGIESPVRAERQTAYQVLVAESKEGLAANKEVVWDSGKVPSNQNIQVVYGGNPLKSQRRYHWKVRVWDKNGNVSGWSHDAWWEMALLTPVEWTGSWIYDGKPDPRREEDFYKEDPAPLFRKDFTIDKPIARARLYISGLGYCEPYLNGQKVGDHVLDPGWTTYSKRVLYSTYDVTERLCQGANCLGAMLGNGWYNPLPMKMWGQLNLRQHLTVGRPRLIAQLNIDFADGTHTSVATDESWKVSEGPILRNNVYLGEVYDARREKPGWNRPGFDDEAWRHARIPSERLGRLQSQSQPPIQATKTFRPTKLSQPKAGVYIFDMGQNFAGWAKLRVSGPAGTKVKLRYGELLRPDGTLNALTTVCGQIKEQGIGGPGAPALADQSDTFILKGAGEDVYTPRFTYHGFRYVEMTGYPGEPRLDSLEGVRVNTAVEEAGSFSCSNELFNRIQKMARNTFPNNLVSVQTDCPARERFGYGDDITCAAEAHLFNYDMAAFYTKTLRDFADAARPNGVLTITAPWTGHSVGGFDDGSGAFVDAGNRDPNAGSGAIDAIIAHPLLLLDLHQFYGDQRIIEEQYEVARRCVEFVRSRVKNNVIAVGLSDWSSIDPRPYPLTGTAHYYYQVQMLSRLAHVLGRNEDAKQYAVLAGEIKDAFIKKFLKPGTGQFEPHTQACQAFALYHDLVPASERQAAVNVLLDEILVRHKGHLSTGIFGTKYLLDALTRIGRADVAFTIVNQKTFPGWGFMLESGATTIWEVWHFSDNTFSHNHSMFGSVSAWFFGALAGIQPHPDAIGFDRIIIKPQIVGDLTWVKGTYNSIRGRIVSNWRLDKGALLLDVVVPVNTTATVYIPSKDAKGITENGKPADQAEGVAFLRIEDGTAVYQVDSGSYSFVARDRNIESTPK